MKLKPLTGQISFSPKLYFVSACKNTQGLRLEILHESQIGEATGSILPGTAAFIEFVSRDQETSGAE